MSDSDEPEYEVEYILYAEVHQGRGRKRYWKYNVKWKGYESEENTMEPEESFEGSKDMLDTFWAGIALEPGKTRDDLSNCTVGDKVMKTGRPRKPKKGKSKPVKPRTPSPDSSEVEVIDEEVSASAPTGNKRRRASDIPDRLRSSKRPKVDTSSSRKASSSKTKPHSTPKPPALSPPVASSARRSTRRKKNEEIIPDSESELTPTSSRSKPAKVADVLMRDPESSADESDGNSARKQGLVAAIDRSLAEKLAPPKSSRKKARANGVSSTSAIPPTPPSEGNKEDRQSAAEDMDAPTKGYRLKPRMKRMDDPSNLTIPDGKAHLLAKTSGSSGSQRQGPKKHMSGADSSRLVATKGGGLTSVKASKQPPVKRPSVQQSVDPEIAAEGSDAVDDLFGDDVVLEPPPPPKTAEELLKEAGVTADDGLEDFNEEDNASNAQPWSEPQTITTLFVAKASTRALPIGLSNPKPVRPSLQFSRSSIFGPLGSASDVRARQTLGSSSDASLTFSLQLDPSSATGTILVIPKNICAGIVGPSLPSIFSKHSSGPPGKFYRKETSLVLLAALRTGGSSAIVEPASTEHAARFENFQTRLDDGDTFVEAWGGESFVFCSSSNADVLTQLNLPKGIVVSPNVREVVMSRVEISNASAYIQAIESVA